MAITTPKREKRPYTKRAILTQDELWKLIIPILWKELIYCLLPDWVEKIDFSKQPEFLDKELKRLELRAKSKNRVVDVLMRVYLKSGEQKAFLLHIEVQGYYDPLLPQRIFQYYYRIVDLLEEPVETLAILIDNDPNYRPTKFRTVCGKTEATLKFRLFKLLDNPPPYAQFETSLFSIVLETAWYALKQNKLKSDADLEALKFRLIRRLLEKNTEPTVIFALIDFILIYLPFGNKKKDSIFEQKIDLLLNPEENMNGIVTPREYLAEKIRKNEREKLMREWRKLERARRQEEEARRQEEEARRQEEQARRQEEQARREEEAEARRREEEQVKKTFVIMNLYKRDFTAEMIADVLLEPLSFVQIVIEQHLKSLNKP
jgi:hypothetical protein